MLPLHPLRHGPPEPTTDQAASQTQVIFQPCALVALPSCDRQPRTRPCQEIRHALLFFAGALANYGPSSLAIIPISGLTDKAETTRQSIPPHQRPTSWYAILSPSPVNHRHACLPGQPAKNYGRDSTEKDELNQTRHYLDIFSPASGVWLG